MYKCFVFLAFVWMWGAGCSIDDRDRCQGGFVWDERTMACYLESSSDAPPDVDGGTMDDGGMGNGGDSSLSGYKKPCSSDKECEGYDATYCLLDPRGGNSGMCTLKDCQLGECPMGSLCCDCAGIGMPVFCAPQEAIQTSPLEQICTCG